MENVRGAQKWVGQAPWHYGSRYYLWGDVPALMPIIPRQAKMKNPGGGSWNRSRPSHTTDHSWDSGSKRYREGVKQKGTGAEWFDNGTLQSLIPLQLTQSSLRHDRENSLPAQFAHRTLLQTFIKEARMLEIIWIWIKKLLGPKGRAKRFAKASPDVQKGVLARRRR